MGLLTDTKLNNNLTTVPEPVRNLLELQAGDRVEWHIEDGDVVVKRLVPEGEDGGDDR